ncbi:MAG: hypothetical protein HY456_02125 [Parcubacteria group bacterium]|nr:hypothetical protein [Parcubacteria group bacterium]
MKDHNHDLIQQLSENADSLWRYDDYIKSAEGCAACVALWKKLKKMNGEIETMLMKEIERHVKEKRFA